MPKSFLLRRHSKQLWKSKEGAEPLTGRLLSGFWNCLPFEKTRNREWFDFQGQKVVEGETERKKPLVFDENANALSSSCAAQRGCADDTVSAVSNQNLREFEAQTDIPNSPLIKIEGYSTVEVKEERLYGRQASKRRQELCEATSKKTTTSCSSAASCKQPYKCEQCGKFFKTKYTLTIHLKMPSHTGARPFVCGICGKGFRLSSTLCRHKIIHTSEKPHKCDICEKAFNRSSTLKTHIRTHSERKEFVCDTCGKGFHQKGNLRNHVLIHTGEKPYRCSLCEKAFNKLSNLKFHMHVHTDNAPYRCRFCKTCFTRRCDLKLHISDCHRRK